MVAAPLATATYAQVVPTTEGFADSSVYTVSNTDLLQTHLASASFTGSHHTSDSFSTSLSTLTDGAFGSAGSDGPSSVGFSDTSTLTFNFDLTVNTAGYNLTNIRTYAGWDSGRDGQGYTVAYSTVSAASTFIDFTSTLQVDVGGAPPVGRTMISLVDGGGVLATNVAAVRFTFTSFEPFSAADAYREIDVFGTVAIPEPMTSGLLFGCGALAVLVALKRVRRPAT